jgi:predicted DNA-binding transcriptional regulator AlpA
MTGIEELLQAALSAPSARKEAALQVLRGQAVAIEPGEQAPAFDRYLTLADLSKAVGVSTSTLWRWRVPGHDLGGTTRYRLSEVESYLQGDAFRRRQAALRAERRTSRGEQLNSSDKVENREANNRPRPCSTQ